MTVALVLRCDGLTKIWAGGLEAARLSCWMLQASASVLMLFVYPRSDTADPMLTGAWRSMLHVSECTERCCAPDLLGACCVDIDLLQERRRTGFFCKDACGRQSPFAFIAGHAFIGGRPDMSSSLPVTCRNIAQVHRLDAQQYLWKRCRGLSVGYR